ncbi:hypothetical protein ACLB1N_32205 [Escherichia coli]
MKKKMTGQHPQHAQPFGEQVESSARLVKKMVNDERKCGDSNPAATGKEGQT